MHLKIVVAGPVGGGKTAISNCICSDNTKISTDKYDPTSGVRILEAHHRIGSEDLNIQIWDSSGDPQYESCWRAIMADSDGVILVYNPDAPSQEQQLGDWFEYFVKKNGLKDEQCMIFAHRSGNSSERLRVHSLFARVTASATTNQSGPDIKNMFERFVVELYNLKARK